jgi:NADH-quinone oxidoreductase subunit M
MPASLRKSAATAHPHRSHDAAAGRQILGPLIAALGVANVAYAPLFALAQKDMKYVVGYSSVSHMGFVLIGIAALNGIGITGAVANMFATAS